MNESACEACGHDVDSDHDPRASDGSCDKCPNGQCIGADPVERLTLENAGVAPEQTRTLTPVRWNDASGQEWDGYASGVTWNGWDEIYVTEETREALRFAWFMPESVCCEHPRAAHWEGQKGGHWAEGCHGAQTVERNKYEARSVGRSDTHTHTCQCMGYEDGASNVTLSPNVEIDGRSLVYLAGFCTSIAEVK